MRSKENCFLSNPHHQKALKSFFVTQQSYPKVAGEELRTSGGTYAAVPTKVHALSSAQVTTVYIQA